MVWLNNNIHIWYCFVDAFTLLQSSCLISGSADQIYDFILSTFKSKSNHWNTGYYIIDIFYLDIILWCLTSVNVIYIVKLFPCCVIICYSIKLSLFWNSQSTSLIHHHFRFPNEQIVMIFCFYQFILN